MLDQRALAGCIALVHRADLRHRDVRLVDHDQEVFGSSRAGSAAPPRRAPVDVAGIVLDTVAEPELLHHLDVECGAHAQTLSLEQLALALELREPILELDLDRLDRAVHGLGLAA